MIRIRSRGAWTLAGVVCASAAALGLTLVPSAQAANPIKIAVIAEAQAVAGASIPQAAQLAADEINAKGGVGGRKIEIVTYDDHSSASDAVRAFQRAVNEDKANAVIASYVSEVVLALEPWAARLKTVMITPGAASDLITKNIHDKYDSYKYIFHGYLTSHALGQLTCNALKDALVDKYGMKSAVIFSEDAAWTTPLDESYEECLPKIGLKVKDHIRFSPDTTDFTPIFNKIADVKPDVIVTGISHVGVQPVTQWKNMQLPIPLAGINSQASNGSFWKDTSGATEGVIFQAVSAADVAVTSKTIPFAQAFKKKYGNWPSYCGYTAYDEVYYIADAVKRAGSTDEDKLVASLEKTDWVGTVGETRFYGKDDRYTHGVKFGKGAIQGLLLQWQKGNQVTIWPSNVAQGKLVFPSFVKLSKAE